MTGPNGLRKHQLKVGRSGKIVSKAKSNKPLNEYMKLSQKARRSGAPSFTYNGNTYYAMKSKTGMTMFTKNRNKAMRLGGGGSSSSDEMFAAW